MANHRQGEPRDDENWPKEDPDEEERTIRNMPPITMEALEK